MEINQNVKKEMVQNNVHVFVMDNWGYRRVSIHDVIYLEASRNYCVIHLVDKSKITVSVPMCEVQEYFSPDLFIRIQRSYIINLEHVSRYIGNYVRMVDDREITIGRDYQESIRKSFILIGSRKRVIEKRKQRYGG